MIRDLENCIDSQVDFVCKKKPVEENSLYIGQQSFLSQTEHVVCTEDTISHLRWELDCKQKVIENLLDTLKSYLHSKSTSHREKHLTSNFDLNNVNKSDTAIYTNKETINIDKETINNNQKQNKKCITVSNQQSNQRHTDNIIEATIWNAINNAEPLRNNNRNFETTKKNRTENNNDQRCSSLIFL